MMEGIIGSIITAVLALVGVIITNMASHSKTEGQIRTAQAVTDEKIDSLARAVDRLSGIAERISQLEAKVEYLEKELANRLERN